MSKKNEARVERGPVAQDAPFALGMAKLLEREGKTVAAAELRRLHELLKEWEAKAATWLASPEAAQRLEGYRELAQRLEKAEAQRDALLESMKTLLDMDPAYGRGPVVEDAVERARAIEREVRGE